MIDRDKLEAEADKVDVPIDVQRWYVTREEVEGSYDAESGQYDKTEGWNIALVATEGGRLFVKRIVVSPTSATGKVLDARCEVELDYQIEKRKRELRRDIAWVRLQAAE